MFSFYQIRKFVLTIILSLMVVITIGFDFGHGDSWVRALSSKVVSPSSPSIETINPVDNLNQNMINKERMNGQS
jgi:hypothetical protein